MSAAFTAANIRVAQPYMMHERRLGWLNADSYFASEKLAGQELLSALPRLEHVEQMQVVSAVKELFMHLETHALSHGDMKATNILWDGKQLALVDLDAAEKHSVSFFWNKANQKDRSRFLRNWVNQPELLALFDFLESDK